MRISKKFTIYFLLPLFSLLALMGAVTYTQTYNYLLEGADRQVLSTAESVNMEITEKINIVKSDLIMMRTYKDIDDYYMYTDVGQLESADRTRGVVQDNFEYIGKLKPQYSAVRFYDEQGSALINVVRGSFSYKTIDVSSAEWFGEALKLNEGESYVSEVYTSQEYVNPVITVAQPVYYKGKPRGVIAVDALIVDLFGDFHSIKEMSIGETGYAYLVSDEGKIILHTDSSILGTDVSGLHSTERIFSGYKGLTTALDEQGITMMRKAFLPQNIVNMGIVISVPTDEIFRPVIELRNFMVPLTLLGLLIIVVIGSVMIRKLTDPVKHLTEVADKISKGEMDVKVDVNSDDEIGELAGSFERMVASIKILMMTEDELSEPS